MAGSIRRLRQDTRSPGRRVRDRENSVQALRGASPERSRFAARAAARQRRLEEQRGFGLRLTEMDLNRDMTATEANRIKNKRETRRGVSNQLGERN
jgi:hypothetical protein